MIRPGRSTTNTTENMTDSQFKRSLPTATYRFQLTPGSLGNNPLKFEDVQKLIPYLKEMGISHVYLSPITTPEKGSEHGYNVVDYDTINPELGGERGFREMATALHDAGIGVIVDYVPNHMSVETRANKKWWDVLKHGKNSASTKFFDIHWDENNDKVALPCAGNNGDQLVDSNELELVREDGEVKFAYHEHRFPVDPQSLESIRHSGESDETLINRLNDSQVELTGLLERQHYDILHWQDGYTRLNYRRFFNINGLAGIRQEDPEVFQSTHGKIGELIGDGLVDGLRIDHIDGLKEPEGYLRQLDALVKEKIGSEARKNFYVVAEKILAPNETLPSHWIEENLLNGTTGYDYLIAAGKLLTNSVKEKLGQIYAAFVGDNGVLDEKAILTASRKRVMLGDERCTDGELEPEFTRNLNALYKTQQAIADAPLDDAQKEALKDAFVEVMTAYPVYRFYPGPEGYSQTDKTRLDNLLAAFPNEGAYASLKDILTLNVPEEKKPQALDFVLQLQQFTGPMVAKGTEDTAFYRYHLLRGSTEVGGELGHISMTPAEFIEFLESRGTQAMNVSSTHDTKLAENARMRNLALSYVPEKWDALANAWKQHTEGYGLNIHPNDQYLLLQTIVATYPLSLLFPHEAGQSGVNAQQEKELYIARLEHFVEKALREGKERTDYVPPGKDDKYEHNAKAFIKRVVHDDTFLSAPLGDGQSPLQFMQRLAQVSANVSLQNTMLKIGAPGIPDFYQNSEQWLHTTVDPDNRKTPDYDKLQETLQHAQNADIEQLSRDWPDGRIKQLVTARLLQARKENPDVFRDGALVPLKVYKGGAEHEALDKNAVAFARISKEDPSKAAIIFIPRLMEADLYKTTGLGLKAETVGESIHIELPDSLKDVHFMDALRKTNDRITNRAGKTELVFTPEMRTLPGAVWVSKMQDAPQQGHQAT